MAKRPPTRTAPSTAASVDDFIAALDPGRRATVEQLRQLVLAAAPGVTEHIKWNAPSFCLDGDDRVTLGLERDGSIRVVLHRGAKVKDAAGFVFADPHAQAKWPAKDRGVVNVVDAADLDARRAALVDLVTRWLQRASS